jgi:hypothetical protein
MLEKLLNVVLWISDLRTRSYDPFINEYRGYQWRMIVSFGSALFMVFMGWFIIPGEQADNRFSQILSAVKYFQLIPDILALALIIYSLVNAVQFWRFCMKHEIWE